VIEGFVRQYHANAAEGGSDSPAWLRQRREAGLSQFQQTGFPSTNDEEWRFTSVAPIARAVFGAAESQSAASLDDLEPFLFGHPEWTRLVFVDGRFVPSLSTQAEVPGLSATPLGLALTTESERLRLELGCLAPPAVTPFVALNTALWRDGALIRVAAGAGLESPVHLLFVTTEVANGAAIHPRVLAVVERDARAQIIESHVALSRTARYLTNVVCELSMGAGSWVEHSRIQRESESGFHVGFTQVSQGRDSHYRSFAFAMGGAIARHDLRTRLEAANTEALLYGLYLAHGEQLVDNHTAIFHDQPNCRSWEVYKGILDGKSHGVFNGKILVKPEAQKTDAKQTNRALLLSDAARIDTKPQLEIFADDVKCTHGATVGNLDQLSSFYLRTRGIPEAVARQVLIYAFAAEVLSEIAAEPVRTALDRLVHDRLGVGQ
jgi:Fe-S cluster assembly protein SufD